ncbi:S24 family peptidase [Bacteroides sp.]|uniref:S24 family peptidase n=1 Tax=Bacteroides sp. TaxID=29523 RepID=UPI0025C64B58|nr:hypothetical protein [Bacteroides sp.]
MGAKQNLKQFLSEKGISPAQFYRDSGLSNGFLNQGDNISSNNLEIIISIYPDLNLFWLISNKGEMLNTLNEFDKNGNPNGNLNGNPSHKDDNSLGDKEYPTEYSDAPLSLVGENEQSPYGIKQEVKVQISKEQLHMPDFLQQRSKTSVPFYNLPVSAGMLGVLESEVFPKNTPDGFLELSVFSGCEAVFPIIGVSMEPIISSGDWIGIKSIDNISRSWDFIQTNVIYLIITREDRMIKFIDKATDEDFIVCRSANASPFKVYKGDILKLYRVKACVKDL